MGKIALFCERQGRLARALHRRWHPNLKGFGANGRLYLRLRDGAADGRSAHLGFVANRRKTVDAAYAANVMDPDGYSLEFVYKDTRTGSTPEWIRAEWDSYIPAQRRLSARVPDEVNPRSAPNSDDDRLG
jgi:hypothetical protein